MESYVIPAFEFVEKHIFLFVGLFNLIYLYLVVILRKNEELYKKLRAALEAGPLFINWQLLDHYFHWKFEVLIWYLSIWFTFHCLADLYLSPSWKQEISDKEQRSPVEKASTPTSL